MAATVIGEMAYDKCNVTPSARFAGTSPKFEWICGMVISTSVTNLGEARRGLFGLALPQTERAWGLAGIL